jgi:branched-chain amino acid transport system ATP-binding protein
MSYLELKGLTADFGGLRAVNNLDVTVREREIVALIGPNGAGKTTVFNLITGVYQPTEGRVFFGDEDITGFKPHRVTKRGVVRTFQVANLFLYSTGMVNMLIAFHLSSRAGFFRSILHTPFHNREQREFTAISSEILELVGLDPASMKTTLAGSLSAGHQRLLALAMAIAARPKMLLLDEMMAGLSTNEIEALLRVVRYIRDDIGPGILWVEHHMKAIMSVADRVVVLNFGSKIAEGTPSEIAMNPDVIKAYLGGEADV